MLLVNIAILAFFLKTGAAGEAGVMQFQTTVFCFFIKRIYCGWRSNLQQLCYVICFPTKSK